MDGSTKMLVNAAVTLLLTETSEDWVKDAQTVIDACREIPTCSHFNSYTEHRGSDERNKATTSHGFAQRAGQYRIGHNAIHNYFLIQNSFESDSLQTLDRMIEAPYGALIPGSYAIVYTDGFMPLYVGQTFSRKSSALVHFCNDGIFMLRQIPRAVQLMFKGYGFNLPTIRSAYAVREGISAIRVLYMQKNR